ncbi:MAG TPA: radical SAM protein, partial [Planctomycetota bacterium]|nr:radical SAM protein [Planctomycetota bacterium]
MQILEPTNSPSSKVVVFTPRWLPPDVQAQRFSHLLMPILGSLVAAGNQVTYLEEGHDGAPTTAWRDLLMAADVVVVWAGEMYPALQIAGLFALLEVMPPAIPLVVGGGFFQLVETSALDMPARVDAVVHGPGEVVVPALVSALRGGKGIEGVAGITYRSAGLVVTTAAPKRGAFDPRWNEVLLQMDLARYRGAEPATFDNHEAALQVHTGSGCAKHCAFCFDEHTPYGVFPAAAVVDAIEATMRRRGGQQIALAELDFFVSKRRVLAIARGLIERGLSLRWFALGSISDLSDFDDDALRTLAESGCHRIEVGTESGSDPMLERMRKRHRVADVLPLVRRLRRFGIRTTHNLLFGVPGETRADRRATLALARAIRRADPHAHLHFRSYQIIPRTSFGQEAMASLPSFPRSLR